MENQIYPKSHLSSSRGINVGQHHTAALLGEGHGELLVRSIGRNTLPGSKMNILGVEGQVNNHFIRRIVPSRPANYYNHFGCIRGPDEKIFQRKILITS